MADEFKRGTSYPVHDTTTRTLGVPPVRCATATLWLDSNLVNFKHIGGSDNEVRDGASVVARGGRKIGIEVGIRLNGWNLGGVVGTGVGDEARSAVLYASRPVHHLVGCKAHLGIAE